MPEADGAYYVQRGDMQTGGWEAWRDHHGVAVRRFTDFLARDLMQFIASQHPGDTFRLADSNSNPLSLPFMVSDQLITDELSKLGTLDIDRVYGEGS